MLFISQVGAGLKTLGQFVYADLGTVKNFTPSDFVRNRSLHLVMALEPDGEVLDCNSR